MKIRFLKNDIREFDKDAFVRMVIKYEPLVRAEYLENHLSRFKGEIIPYNFVVGLAFAVIHSQPKCESFYREFKGDLKGIEIFFRPTEDAKA